MNKRLILIGCLTLITAAYGQSTGQRQTSTPPAASAPAASAPAASEVAKQKAIIDQYCVTCHNQKAKTTVVPEGQAPSAAVTGSLRLTLDNLDLARVSEHPDIWEKVVRKLRAGMMPPVNIRRPDPATYKGLITWLEGELDRTAAAYAPPPGLHRMNRTEYANAIRDMLALEVDPGQYLPSDDSTRGFDNNAGVLGVSSTLVEAYVTAAGKISRLAIGEPTTPTLKVYRTPEDTSQDYHVEGLPFGTRGGLLVSHAFPSEGEYQITITPIFGDNMSPTGFGTISGEKLEVMLDGQVVQVLDWQGGRGGGFGGGAAAGNGAAAGGAAGGNAAQGAAAGANAQAAGGNGQQAAGQGAAAGQAAQGGGGFGGGGGRNGGGGMKVRMKTTAGTHTLGVTFKQTNLAPILDLEQHFMRDTLQTGPTPGYTFFPHVGTVRIEGPFNAVAASDSPSRRKIFVCRPSATLSETACARRIITSLATQAYRHPATTEDIAPLMEFYAEGRKEGDFDHAVEMALARILSAPKFVYRIENEPANVSPGQLYRISDLDLASRLSYFLWSAAPDAQLRNLASQGKLKDPVVLDAQVKRMLKDPRAEALSVNFAGQWLNLRGLQAAGPLPMLFPDFDDPLRQSMRREVEMFFDSIVREDHNVLDMLTADYTFVNERLAKHYGIKNVYGSQFRRITLGPDMDARRGLLGKASLLTTTSKPEGTNPPRRGNWIMTNFLGVPAPDPPKDVPALKPKPVDARANAKTPTTRERFQDHRVRADCIQCHSMMDPIAFALENFDGIGMWRTSDEGSPIDTAVTLFDGTKVSGPADLRNWMITYSDTFNRVITEKLMIYALGRGVDYRDMPLVRSIVRDAAAQNNRFSAFVLGIVKSKPFQMNMKITSNDTNTKKEGN
jgi:hypothetical protein